MKNLNKPLSIITIVLNGEAYLEQTILSVINQKNIGFEYIIIDGGSKDSSREIINRYKDQIDIFICEKDEGIYDAINKGILQASGDLIGIIHCGDYFLPNAFSTVYNKFCKSKADVIYGKTVIIEEINGKEFKSASNPNHLQLEKGMSIQHPSTFVSRDCYFKNGLYDKSFKVAADYALFLNYFLLGVSFFKVDQEIAVFRAGGLSSLNSKNHSIELLRIHRHYLGNTSAYSIFIKRILINNYYILRKKLIIFLIGKNKYNYLKFKQKKYLAE